MAMPSIRCSKLYRAIHYMALRIDPKNQALVLVKHRKGFALVKQIFSCFEFKQVNLTAVTHDRITANTQAVTYAVFTSMGTLWCANNQFLGEYKRSGGDIENMETICGEYTRTNRYLRRPHSLKSCCPDVDRAGGRIRDESVQFDSERTSGITQNNI